jgi:CBS-domain-containing membrane protein
LNIVESNYLFIDESGNHGLTKINKNSSVFLLCGILFNSEMYQHFRKKLNDVKLKFWNSKEIVFHSRDIRKCQKEFSNLLDSNLKLEFYNELNKCIKKSEFTIIAAAIRKEDYIKKYGMLSNDVYEIALSFIIERAIFKLDQTKYCDKTLDIVLEERGHKENSQLKVHFQRLKSRGTGYVTAERLRNYNLNIHFRNKKDNVNGLQLADLIAYPCARHVMDPESENISFDIFRNKIYSGKDKRYGLKIFP